MMAASTIWMSGGWIASGPPATGTCHTMERYGVACTAEPLGQGGAPEIDSDVVTEDVPGAHTWLRRCHCTSAPYGMGTLSTLEGRMYMAAASTGWLDGVVT
jgi:hypothetical protein